ncbi:hypothetical protein L1049_020889 [Liquidambar formosana]|uniref:Zinc finger PMZ-type domain-containing protein n=1 Tax=Liquidambar formosana TaxID=63359 RepID=A0AAP0S8G7_LIQFO
MGIEKAQTCLYGDNSKSFDQLRWFIEESMRTNLASKLVLDMDECSNQFKRFFASFYACIYGFTYCRPMLFVNGTFLKSHRYGEMCSNVAESFKAWIKEARFLLITNMVDLIKSHIMAQMCNRKLEANYWNTVLCLKMDKRLGEELDKGRTWRFSMSSDSVFEMNGFPCLHTVVAIQASGGDINDYVEDYFYTSSFREAYFQAIHPISTALKVGVSEENCEFNLSPNTRRPTGRLKNRRIPSRGEKIRQIKCDKCGRLGTHNKKTCQEPI